MQYIEPSSDETTVDSDYIDEVSSESDDEMDLGLEEDDDPLPESAKPEATRVLIEVQTLLQTLEKHCRCEHCFGSLKPELKTVCLAIPD
jgi:hypothetical protein